MVVRNAACLEAGERGAGAVDVVDTPAAEPGAVLLLLGQEPFEPVLGRVAMNAERPERLEGMRRDVGAGLVRHLAEVAERDLVEPHGLVVDVEGAPAAVA